jgi:hypothetical protein
VNDSEFFLLEEKAQIHSKICHNFYFILLFSGYGAGGRLGIGGTDSVCQPTLLESIQHISIKIVSYTFTKRFNQNYGLYHKYFIKKL